MWRGVKIGAAAVSVFAVAGCQTTDDDSKVFGAIGGAIVGGVVGSQVGSGTGRIVATAVGAGLGAWLGAKFAELLTEKDQENLATSTQQAALTGKTQSWSNPESGVSGVTTVRQTSQETKPTQVRVLKDRVKETPSIEFINQTFEVLKNSNVRGGPGTDYVIVDSLVAGETAIVLGKVEGEDWYLISENGAGAGYVFAPLLRAVPDEPVMAPTESPPPTDEVVEVTINSGQTCRIITQEVTLTDGSVEEDEVTVCNGPNGWEIA